MNITNRSVVAVVGLGLMGGSFVLALRKRGFKGTVHALVRDVPAIEQTKAGQACDLVTDDAVLAIAKADLVMLSVPLDAYAPVMAEIGPLLRPQAVLTDMGSVKEKPMQIMQSTGHQHVVPAHPIAGKETSGAAAADATLFVHKNVVITELEETEAGKAVEALWKICGSHVARLLPAQHDEIYAYVSHLPQFMAFNLPKIFHTTQWEKKTSMWHFTRLCASSRAMWQPIFAMNETYLTAATQRFWEVAAPVAAKYHLSFPTVAGWLAGHQALQDVALDEAQMEEIGIIYAKAVLHAVDAEYQSFGGSGFESVMEMLQHV